MKTAICGTYAGAVWHQKMTEPLCDPCKAARARYLREYRASHPDYTTKARMQTRALSRAQRVVANAHPDELAAAYATELEKETG